MPQLMRTSNPALGDQTFTGQPRSYDAADRMSVNGTINKTGILLVLADETDRFKAGVDDTLPLVQAQSTLASAQTTLVESLYQFNVAKLQLARNTGLLEQQYKTYLGN